MTFKEFWKREIYVAIHAQTGKFRVVKYFILLLLLAGVYTLHDGAGVVTALVILLAISIATHFFFRHMTEAWSKPWGLYTQPLMTDYTVIGKTRNRDEVRRLIEGIRAKGKTCYDFTIKAADPNNPTAPAADQMQVLESHGDFFNDPVHREHFERDRAGLFGAGAVVLLLPAGTSSHIESGIAYGLGKRLILIGEPEKPETLYHIFEERYKTIEEFLATL